MLRDERARSWAGWFARGSRSTAHLQVRGRAAARPVRRAPGAAAARQPHAVGGVDARPGPDPPGRAAPRAGRRAPRRRRRARPVHLAARAAGVGARLRRPAARTSARSRCSPARPASTDLVLASPIILYDHAAGGAGERGRVLRRHRDGRDAHAAGDDAHRGGEAPGARQRPARRRHRRARRPPAAGADGPAARRDPLDERGRPARPALPGPAGRPTSTGRRGGTPAQDASVDPETDEILVDGVPLRRGVQVRLRPGAKRADAQDMFLDGRLAHVEAVLNDVDGQTHLAVALDDLVAGRRQPARPLPLLRAGRGRAARGGRVMRTLVAGLGNIFHGDDGVGVAVAQALRRPNRCPTGVVVRDFGIRGVHLAYELLDGYDLVVIVDAVQRGGAAGHGARHRARRGAAIRSRSDRSWTRTTWRRTRCSRSCRPSAARWGGWWWSAARSRRWSRRAPSSATRLAAACRRRPAIALRHRARRPCQRARSRNRRSVDAQGLGARIGRCGRGVVAMNLPDIKRYLKMRAM